jgi:hypothetical protein
VIVSPVKRLVHHFGPGGRDFFAMAIPLPAENRFAFGLVIFPVLDVAGKLLFDLLSGPGEVFLMVVVKFQSFLQRSINALLALCFVLNEIADQPVRMLAAHVRTLMPQGPLTSADASRDHRNQYYYQLGMH